MQVQHLNLFLSSLRSGPLSQSSGLECCNLLTMNSPIQMPFASHSLTVTCVVTITTGRWGPSWLMSSRGQIHHMTSTSLHLRLLHIPKRLSALCMHATSPLTTINPDKNLRRLPQHDLEILFPPSPRRPNNNNPPTTVTSTRPSQSKNMLCNLVSWSASYRTYAPHKDRSHS